MRGLRLAAVFGLLGVAAEAQIADVLRNTLEGRTVVVVTHDPEVAKRARTILRLRDGVLVGKDR